MGPIFLSQAPLSRTTFLVFSPPCVAPSSCPTLSPTLSFPKGPSFLSSTNSTTWVPE
ncbi:unnamed protein product [Sphenostylis stenocarpa]|uniref:Uncharacterized protein n=1 Tax=Sphenostylis stenocarpa TaxID=92480 RepID=A0AA86SNH9_9FABA|nr:unnamed protein product [Sphenostylis stenocarpa]